MARNIVILRRFLKAAGTGAARSLLLAAGLAALSPAHAQGPASAAQGANDPAGLSSLPTIDRDRSDRTTPAIPAAPRAALPSPAPSVAAGTSSPATAATTLVRVRFAGASLAPSRLDAAVADYVGRPLNAENLQAIATAVGRAYANSDIAYYSVSIPAQTPNGGILTVRIVEGVVKQYTLAGVSVSTPTGLIEAHVARIMRETPLHKSVLERSLSLMRDIPGQTVSAQVRQLDGQGSLALDLTIKRKQVAIALTVDNSGVSNVVQGVQVQAAVTVNGLLREGDSTRVSSYLPFHPDNYQFYALSHSTPIGTNGMVATANAAHVRTQSIDQNIKGEATLAGISINYPLIRSYKTNVSLSASIDGVDSSNYFLDTRFGDYRSRAIRAGGSWSQADEKNGYAISAVVSRGLDIFGAKAFTGFSEKAFTKLNVQSVAARSVKKNLLFKLSVNGQYTRDKLPVTERIALGGPGAGRPYRVGVITADRAVTGRAELAFTLPITSGALKGTSLFTFADGAVARTVSRPIYSLPARSYSLASAGGGARVSLGGKWSASIEAAAPIKRPESNFSRKVRLFFGLGRSF